RIYLMDRDNMGKLSSTGSDSQSPQSVLGGMPSLFGNPAYFNHWLYFCGSGSHLGAYSISNAQMSTAPVSQSYEKYGYPGCVPTISANGKSNAIVWTLEPFVGLHAYDANDLGHELYNSGADASPGATVKYSAPMVANGKVYAGRDSVLAVYGLLSAGAAGLPAANSASGDVGSVAPGGLTTIYGSGLAAGTESATGFPLPTSLAGTSVTVGGYTAPMLYASGGQVNFQVPFEVPPGTAVFTVFVNGSAVASGSLNVLATAPGVFMMDGSQAAVVNQNGSLNSLGSPATVGSVVSLFATGLGTVSPQVASGAPAPSGSTSNTNASVTVTVGTATGQLQFAGLAPGFAGLYQVNVVVPARPAGQYAVKLTAGGAVSNVATIAVQ
ncbi:MAG TPA: IPT/TIG domain-containing protein, partial [Bryobacteraceae bacterium]|nr:IPT/TIG domain-containing protein [Bryobacteraceae bacterium]